MVGGIEVMAAVLFLGFTRSCFLCLSDANQETDSCTFVGHDDQSGSDRASSSHSGEHGGHFSLSRSDVSV